MQPSFPATNQQIERIFSYQWKPSREEKAKLRKESNLLLSFL
jgi:hypothetical protein